MTGLTAGILPGAAFWILTHVWCHRRYLAMEAGDLEELGGERPSEGLAAALEAGIELGTVSPRAARLAHERGIITAEVSRKALLGAYRRNYDRTLPAEIPWLPAYLVMSILGSQTSGAASVLLSAVVSTAQCDTRFRVIPTALAFSMIPMGAFAVPSATGYQVVLKVAAAMGTFAMAALAMTVARRRATSFGAGDIFLLASTISSLAGTTALTVFLMSLTAELAIRASWGRRAAASRDIPLAAYLVAPMALAYMFT